MYRDDLEAALARNAILERRVAELEGAHVSHVSRPAAVPMPRPVVASASAQRVEQAPGSITYIRPATWFPLWGRLVHSVRHTWRSLLAKRPSWNVPDWSSPIVVLHALARPAAWVGACIGMLTMTVWFALGLVWFAPALAISLVGFIMGSIALVPILAIASIQRRHVGSEHKRIEWGVVRPALDAPDELQLWSLLGLSLVQAPLVMWLV